MWIPSSKTDVKLINFIESNLLNLEKRITNEYASQYGYFNPKSNALIFCNGNNNVINYSNISTSYRLKRIGDYSDEDINELLYFILKTYYNLDNIKLRLCHFPIKHWNFL